MACQTLTHSGTGADDARVLLFAFDVLELNGEDYRAKLLLESEAAALKAA
jgi:ATP-dependent DNA ligase